jgi:hypothetical protein
MAHERIKRRDSGKAEKSLEEEASTDMVPAGLPAPAPDISVNLSKVLQFYPPPKFQFLGQDNVVIQEYSEGKGRKRKEWALT